jgi:hypothetical protein
MVQREFNGNLICIFILEAVTATMGSDMENRLMKLEEMMRDHNSRIHIDGLLVCLCSFKMSIEYVRCGKNYALLLCSFKID